MHAFRHQESEQTLAQGIEEYLAASPGLAQARLMSPAAQEFFRCHDAAHVCELRQEFGIRVAHRDAAGTPPERRQS